MSKKQVRVVMVGIGGYGANHVREMLQDISTEDAVLAGVVDVSPEKSLYYEQLKQRNVPMFATLESFYETVPEGADLAVISTPIQYHCPQTCLALKHGSNVLVEKPISATVQEAKAMMEAERQAEGLFVAVGYNWSFGTQIQQLKADIQSGLFGAPRQLKTLVLWRRKLPYFELGWKGRKKSPAGDWILDSVAHNATSHYLHNMFYLLGATTETSAAPKWVQAELYRANRIENFDTCAVRAETEDGAELLFVASHTIPGVEGPNFIFEFEHATITYQHGQDQDEIIAVFRDGTEKRYAAKTAEPEQERSKLLICIQAVQSGSAQILCGLEAAYPQVLCMNGMLESTEIKDFPGNLVHRDEEEQLVWVEGLKETLWQCYEQGKLPSELGEDWSNAGKVVDLTGYSEYQGSGFS